MIAAAITRRARLGSLNNLPPINDAKNVDVLFIDKTKATGASFIASILVHLYPIVIMEIMAIYFKVVTGVFLISGIKFFFLIIIISAKLIKKNRC